MLGTRWCYISESRLEGVDRRKLKFTTLNTLQGGVSVRIKSESEREGKKSTKKIKRMTWWFVLPRFGSKEPNPRWRGHKDRVSFNPFPLSNGHLDWVSFLHNQMGHLDPTRTTTHLVSLSLITSVLRTRMRKKKANQATRATRKHKWSSHKS
jgi:hypothetical protein